MARPGLDNHPKFRRLMHILSESRAHCRGHLECLWEVAYECGNPRIGDVTDVELAADWHGDSGKFCEALETCGGQGRAGFIETTGEPGCYKIHDLYDHAPEYVRKRMDREEARKRRGVTLQEIRSNAASVAAKARWQQTDALRMQDDASCLPCGTTPAPAPAPAPKKERRPADAGSLPVLLLELIDGWNGLGNKIVLNGNGARRGPPAKAVVTGWRRADKTPDQREAFKDIPALLTAIRAAKFCHCQGWFTLPWLFGKNKNGEFNVCRLLAGAHTDGRESVSKPPQEPIKYRA